MNADAYTDDLRLYLGQLVAAAIVIAALWAAKRWGQKVDEEQGVRRDDSSNGA